MKKIINQAVEKGKKFTMLGKVADYIPELGNVDPDLVGICITDMEGNQYCGGDYNRYFTIQSISKVVSLILALEDNCKDYVFKHVGVSPTAESFNSITQLETKNEHKPMNPFINSGAIVTLSMVNGIDYEQKFNRIKRMMEKMINRDGVEINSSVYQSERLTGNRNRALAYYMQSTKVFNEDVEKILDVYFRICSFKVNCIDISNMAATLSNGGVSVYTGERIISKETVKIINVIMSSCGLYEGSGKFALDVGVPSKSGVGGGIVSIVPGKLGIGVFGPSLDLNGNSIAGIKMLEYVNNKLELSIY